VAQLVPGIGPAAARRLLDAIHEQADALSALAAFKPPSGAASQWPELVRTFTRLRRGEIAWPDEVAYAVQWYRPLLERLYEDVAVRLA
ncbi:hypothetical protein OFC41_30255, partial [Escherichia coli]|nr:hypothetical protein [Escherichia coli]